MANLRFYRTNEFDLHTLSYSSQDDNFPAINARNRWFRRTWRTQSSYLSNQFLKIYSATKISVDSLIMKYHNLTGSATLKFQGSDDNFATTPLDVTVPITAGVIVYSHASVASHYYFRIYISDAANPDGYLEVGRVFFGLKFDPRYGFDPTRDEAAIDPSVLTESENGQEAAIYRERYAEIAYKINAMDVADQAIMREIIDAVGASKAFFLTEFPSLADPYLRTLYVRAAGWIWTPFAGGWKALAFGVRTER